MLSAHRLSGIHFTWTATVIVVFFVASLAAAPLPQQLNQEQRMQMQQQAILLGSQPTRMSVKALTQGTKVGEKSRVEISVRTPDNEPVPAKEDYPLEISLTFSSGAVSTSNVTIKKGETSTQFEFVANEPGLTSVIVRSQAAGLLPDKTDVLVIPAAPRKRAKQAVKHTSSLGAPTVPRRREGAQFLLAHFSPLPAPEAPGGGHQDPLTNGGNTPALHVSANDVGSDFFANGKDAVIISAYFESPDGAPAPTNIHVWFTWTNGKLDPSPLQIDKGKFSGEAHLTSRWPTKVHVRLVSVSPSYSVAGDKEFDIRFVPPGVALVGPEKLSVVDNEPIMVVFYNELGIPIATGDDWKVTLRSKRSKLRFVPGLVEVKQNSSLGSASLFPTSFGADTIEAIIPDYQPKPLNIIVTGWLVLGLCAAGGVAGGLAAYNKFKGSWFWRIFLGVLGGALLCWLYVYLALPNVDKGIAHNTFSVFFVALVGGYLGTTTLDFAAKKLGLSP